MVATSDKNTNDCLLLTKLPAELRNNIYELAFDEVKNTNIDLVKARPPGDALLYTCHEIFEEARGIFNAACVNSWSKNYFVLRLIYPGRTRGGLRNAPTLANLAKHTYRALNLIRRLEVKYFEPASVSSTGKYTSLPHGLWTWHELTSAPGSPSFIFVAKVATDQTDSVWVLGDEMANVEREAKGKVSADLRTQLEGFASVRDYDCIKL